MDKKTKMWIGLGVVGLGVWYLMKDRVGTVEAGPLTPSYGAGGGSTMGSLSKTSPAATQGISQPTYTSNGALSTVQAGGVTTPQAPITGKERDRMEQPTGKNFLYVGNDPVVKIVEPSGAYRAGLIQ